MSSLLLDWLRSGRDTESAKLEKMRSLCYIICKWQSNPNQSFNVLTQTYKSEMNSKKSLRRKTFQYKDDDRFYNAIKHREHRQSFYDIIKEIHGIYIETISGSYSQLESNQNEEKQAEESRVIDPSDINIQFITDYLYNFGEPGADLNIIVILGSLSLRRMSYIQLIGKYFPYDSINDETTDVYGLFDNKMVHFKDAVYRFSLFCGVIASSSDNKSHCVSASALLESIYIEQICSGTQILAAFSTIQNIPWSQSQRLDLIEKIDVLLTETQMLQFIDLDRFGINGIDISLRSDNVNLFKRSEIPQLTVTIGGNTKIKEESIQILTKFDIKQFTIIPKHSFFYFYINDHNDDNVRREKITQIFYEENDPEDNMNNIEMVSIWNVYTLKCDNKNSWNLIMKELYNKASHLKLNTLISKR